MLISNFIIRSNKCISDGLLIQSAYFSTCSVRLAESCVARFPPNLEKLSQATTVKHIHFKGITDYRDGNKIQNYLLDQHIHFKLAEKSSRAIFQAYPTILTFEFSSVYTGGKRERDSKKATNIPFLSGNKNDVQEVTMTSAGVPYIQTDRGGQVTYHGPGQLVAYFIWDLKLWRKLSSKCFVNYIEQCSINTISHVGVADVCRTENTGVWVSKGKGTEEKISSIGLNIKRNVTSHGLSINLSTNLKYLNNPEFVMCGLKGYHQTSIEKELNGLPVDLDVERLADILCDTVKLRMDSYMMNLPGKDDYKMRVEKTVIDLQRISLSSAYKMIDDIAHV